MSVYWDTHNRNFIDLKTRLMPAGRPGLQCAARRPFRAVCWTKPWSSGPANSAVLRASARASSAEPGGPRRPRSLGALLQLGMAGAGIQGGTVHGRSDRWAAYPARDPVTPADIAATIYHCLGVSPATELIDALNRPLALCLGRPIGAILA